MAHLGPHLYSESDPDAIIEPASEIFEIDDFTSPSDWEKFVSQVEHIIREWELTTKGSAPRDRSPTPGGPAQAHGPWRRQSTSLSFYGFEFLITWHYRVKDEQVEESNASKDDSSTEKSPKDTTPDAIHAMMQPGHEFGSRFLPLHYYYGLNEFVTFSPNAPREKEDIDNETRAKMALSTISVAVHNTQCQVPFFVQVMERQKSMFVGVFAGGGIRTDFQMIVLSRKPSQTSHLSGLLSMFKSKISTGSIVDIPSVRVTARTTYHLNDWTNHVWSQSPPDLDMFTMLGGQLGFINDLSTLPFGSIVDPVKRLILHATWTDLQEEIITDNEVHSDLDPLEAPSWSIEITLEDQPQCLMKDYLHEFASLCDRHDTLKMILGDLTEVRTNQDENLEKIPNVFDRLTGGTSNYSLPEILQAGNSRNRSFRFDGPIKDEYLSRILDYLFPDSNPKSGFPYPKEFERSQTLAGSCGVSTIGIKSSPVDGIVWRLTVVLSHCLHVLGGIRAFAHLIHEFMLEVRYRWESGHMLPGLPLGPPDHAYCLFHQKLQMINCCIEKKLHRENQSSKQKLVSVEKVENFDVDADDDDPSKSETDEEEFFDCDDENEEQEEMEVDDEDHPKPTAEIPHWSREPSGRQTRLRNIRLLEHDDWIYVPVCQDPTPMTEDMLAEQAEVMLQLGMDAEGAELRAKMQSSSLLSDMESFKAANPGSVLADFVRWHSPRDWEESSDGKGKGAMSPRMLLPGNIWQETWENAKPVPARRQKRLFDDTREAEKVIQFLSQLRPCDVSQMLIPNLLHSALLRILQEGVHIENIPHGIDLVKESVQKLTRLSRCHCLPEISHYKTVTRGQDDELTSEFGRRASLVRETLRLMQLLEHKVSISFSLYAKFLKNVSSVEATVNQEDRTAVEHQMKDLVSKLQSTQQVQILGGSRGPTGQLICRMFYDAQRASHFVIENEETDDFIDVTGKDHKTIFPRPESGEFILRTFAARPYPYSAPTPQRMYALIRDHEFRVAGAFSIDKQFL